LSADPNDMERGDALVFAGDVCQTLTDIDPANTDVTPLLATSWEQTNPTTWIFHLRKGVNFQDGTPFNADAAVFSINRALNTKEITCTDKAKVAEQVKPAAIDPYTLQLTTNVPAPSLPRELAFVHMSSPTATPAKEKTDRPVGTGPYKFVSWVRGQSITVERWDGYWGPKPEVEKATVVFRGEPSVRAQMVTTGEADLAVPITQEYATKDDRTKQFSIASTFYLRLPRYVAPMNDIRVREAVEYAIDKKDLADKILGRTGIATSQVLAQSNNGYIPSYTGPSYDPAKAKALIAAAKADGVPVDRKIDFVAMTNQFAYSDQAMQYIVQNLQDVGFNINLQTVDPARWADILFHKYNVEQNPTILAVKNRNPTGDASLTFTSYLDPKGCCSESKDTTLEGLINTARQTADPKARMEAFRAAAMYEYTKDISLVPIAELNGLLLISKRIEYTPNAQTYGMQLKLADIHFTK